MLAELAAANAAFQVIKSAVQNGKEIASAGKAIANFVGAKEQLQERHRRRVAALTSKSLWLSNRYVNRKNNSSRL